MQLIAVGDVPVLNLRHAMELTEACEGPLGAKSMSRKKVVNLRGKWWICSSNMRRVYVKRIF